MAVEESRNMPRFSQFSLDNLSTCDDKLQRVFREVIRHIDCRVTDGHRTQAEQDLAYNRGHSEKKWPNSKHNQLPSKATDIVPYPVDWEDRERFTLFAGFVMGVASQMGIRLRWGGDWNSNFVVQDNKFDDFAHFELVE
jgi:peptidoglycan L-alanyl-D-glutamate endopeptidase CwlK